MLPAVYAALKLLIVVEAVAVVVVGVATVGNNREEVENTWVLQWGSFHN